MVGCVHVRWSCVWEIALQACFPYIAWLAQILELGEGTWHWCIALHVCWRSCSAGGSHVACAGCRANLVTHTNTHLHYNCTWLLRMPWAHSSDTLQTLQWQWGPFCTQVSTTSCLFSRCAWGSHLSWPCLAHGCGTCRRGVLTYMLCLAHSSIGRSLRL